LNPKGAYYSGVWKYACRIDNEIAVAIDDRSASGLYPPATLAWGQDRLWLLEDVLAKKRPSAETL